MHTDFFNLGSKASTKHSAPKTAISLTGVGVRFRKRRRFLRKRAQESWALRDVSFKLYQGDSLGIIGRNGSGKSSLLRVMAGIIRPDRGTIHNSGQQATLLSLQVGFLSHLSGRKNAILSGMLLGMRKKDIERNMDQIIAFSELQDYIDEPIRTYSSGMRARLGFATAFQADPDVLLVDEILGVGDADFVKKSAIVMMNRIRSDKTAVLVSHNANLIRRLCNRVLWIDQGVTRCIGECEEVLAAYAADGMQPKGPAPSRTTTGSPAPAPPAPPTPCLP